MRVVRGAPLPSRGEAQGSSWTFVLWGLKGLPAGLHPQIKSVTETPPPMFLSWACLKRKNMTPR